MYTNTVLISVSNESFRKSLYQLSLGTKLTYRTIRWTLIQKLLVTNIFSPKTTVSFSMTSLFVEKTCIQRRIDGPIKSP